MQAMHRSTGLQQEKCPPRQASSTWAQTTTRSTAICLYPVRDRTILLPCVHDWLCFDCILVWTGACCLLHLSHCTHPHPSAAFAAQLHKCPLCNAPIGPFLIHDLHSKYDHSKYYLPPLWTLPLCYESCWACAGTRDS